MRKEFVDKNKVKKERRLQQEKVAPVLPVIPYKESKKGLKDSKRETKTALDQHSLGWTTVSGEEF